VEALLRKARSFLKNNSKTFVIDENGEEEPKSKILWRLSVAKSIGIKQTRKTKSLYLSVVFENNRLITFYPPTRVKEKITFNDFSEELLREVEKLDACLKSLK